jgi:hypothetical protein
MIVIKFCESRLKLALVNIPGVEDAASIRVA